ncbi:MAG: hypothetical protein LBD93_07725 [Treponema sp.]|nr:hypothetical protein [Treponema sp.]
MHKPGMKITGWLLGILPLFLVCSSCATLVEKAGQVLEGSLFVEKTLGVYRGAEGMEIRYVQVKTRDPLIKKIEKMVVSLKAYPGAQLWTSPPDEAGRVFLQELRFLGGSYTGWNEFTLDLTGEALLILQRNSALWRGQEPIERVQISRGKIRREQKRLVGEEALTALRNRYARIAALTEWMHAQEDLPDFAGQKDFGAYWKPLLMPELVGPKKRPAGWTAEAASWVRGEAVLWNQDYTEKVFPESLWGLRNSGALLRDWEEALSWIYLDYQWDKLIRGISQEYILTKIK